ncbi:MAG: response regulator [Pseudomonadota bacterium]|jgi:two-component system response regulator RegA
MRLTRFTATICRAASAPKLITIIVMFDKTETSPEKNPLTQRAHRGHDAARGILIVDDNQDFCSVMARALRRRGLCVHVAHDEASALSTVQEEPAIDRVVLDLNLGRPISGLHLLTRLRAAHPHLRIVLLTAYASLATATEAIRCGAVHYLAKPASVDEVLAAFSREVADATVQVAKDVLSCPQLEWERLCWALVRHDGNISATARFLGLERRSLQRKLKKHARR